ncbi:Ribonuclease P protein subunit p25-like protein [Linum perenne]
MDRYTRVEKPKPESPINENEIRITSSGPVRNYISYATSLLQDKHAKEIVLKAMGQAISKTVSIAESIKRRNPRLHQDTGISSVSITDVWEPIEEGLVPVEQTRQVSMITITLSFNELDKNSPGYQAPQAGEQSKQQYQQQPQFRQARVPYYEEVEGGEEVETGAGVDMDMETIRKTIRITIKETIRRMVVIQTGDVVVGEVEIGGIEVLVMKEVAEVVIMKGAELAGMKEEEVAGMKEAGVDMEVVEVVGTRGAEVVGMRAAEVVGMREAEVAGTEDAEVVVGMKEAGVVDMEEGGTVAMKVAEVMDMKEAELEDMVEGEEVDTKVAEVMDMKETEEVDMKVAEEGEEAAGAMDVAVVGLVAVLGAVVVVATTKHDRRKGSFCSYGFAKWVF